jgi:hypothetical protein
LLSCAVWWLNHVRSDSVARFTMKSKPGRTVGNIRTEVIHEMGQLRPFLDGPNGRITVRLQMSSMNIDECLMFLPPGLAECSTS